MSARSATQHCRLHCPVLTSACCPAHDLGGQLSAAAALSALVQAGASPQSRPAQQPGGIISPPSTDQAASLEVTATCTSPQLFTSNLVASSALPGTTGLRCPGSPSHTCLWRGMGVCGVSSRPCVAAWNWELAGCCRQPSMRLAYAGRRGLGLCLEMLWQGAPMWWPKCGAMPVIEPTWQKAHGAHFSLRWECPCPPSMAIYTTVLLTGGCVVLLRTLRAAANVSHFLT